LEEGKPPVPDRQKNHPDDLHRPDKFPRDDAGIRNVFSDQRNRAHEKADKIGLDKGPLDLPVQNLAGPVDDDPLGQEQCTGRPEDGPGNRKLPIIFRQKDEAHRRREKETDRSDYDGGHRVDHEQRVEALAGGEVKFELSHGRRLLVLVLDRLKVVVKGLRGVRIFYGCRMFQLEFIVVVFFFIAFDTTCRREISPVTKIDEREGQVKKIGSFGAEEKAG
jgi:hypothetical protein